MQTEEKEKSALEASEQNATNPDNSPVTPTEENKEAEIPKDIDPRVVKIIGEDKIKSAFAPQKETGEEKKEEEEKSSEDEKKVEVDEKQPLRGEDQEQAEEENVEQEQKQETPDQQPTPSRLDRRLASKYIHNLHLAGEEEIPTEEEVIAQLANVSKQDKIDALHFHMKKAKELTGDSTKVVLEEEDREAILDAEREEIRREVLTEQEEVKKIEKSVEFLEDHPELIEGNKEYNPKLARAVEALWEKGMSIPEAFETVNDQIQAVKEAQAKAEKKETDSALSGILSGTGQVPTNTDELTWEDVDKIEKDNPVLYRQMLKEGKFKHLM